MSNLTVVLQGSPKGHRESGDMSLAEVGAVEINRRPNNRSQGCLQVGFRAFRDSSLSPCLVFKPLCVCVCVCECVYVCMCVCPVHASSTESTIVQRKKMFPPEEDEFPSVPYLVLQKALCMVDAQLK